jgi:hypothetical protein
MAQFGEALMDKNVSDAAKAEAALVLKRAQTVSEEDRRLGSLMALDKEDRDIYAPGATEAYYIFGKLGFGTRILAVYETKGWAKIINTVYNYENERTWTYVTEMFGLPDCGSWNVMDPPSFPRKTKGSVPKAALV